MFASLKLACILCCFCIISASGRIVPYYDLDEDFYSDIRNILDDHLSRQVVNPVYHPREVRGWGLTIPNSQVAGVAVDLEGNPVIVHRGNRFWDYNSFNSSQHFQQADPIPEDVVITLSRETGKIIQSWGKDLFYLPHGIVVDGEGNIWITDVGLHQVLKFSPGSTVPSLTLGQKLQPGTDTDHYCKPTAVAVASSGEFFVADGYCNARVLHYTPDGAVKGIYEESETGNGYPALNVPHGLSLNEALDVLCIADRENGRIVCIQAGTSGRGKFGKEVALIPEPNHIRVFDIDFVGNGLVGVSGSGDERVALGFTASLEHGLIVDQWEPVQGFHNPHSITVDEKRRAIYVAETGPNRVWKFILDAATGGEI